MAKGDVNLSISGDATGLLGALNAAKEATAAAAAEMKTAVESVSDTFGKLQTAALAFTAVLAGGEAFKKIIADSQEWNIKAVELSRALGITTEKASVYMTALQHLGIDSEVLIGASVKMSKAMHTNSEAFDKLGIKTHDAEGNFRSAGDVLQDTLLRLEAINNPIERNIAGVTLFGKGWTQMIPLMRLTSQQMQDAEARARALGLIVGPEGAAAAEEYKFAMNDVSLVGKSLEMQLGKALLPTLTSLGAAFAKTGPEIGNTFGNILKFVSDVAYGLWNGLQGLGNTVGALGAAVSAVLHGDFAGAKAIMVDLKGQLADLDKQYEDFHKRIWDPPPPQTSAAPDLTNQGIDEALTKSHANLQKLSAKFAEDEIRDANQILNEIKRTTLEEAEAHEETKLGEIAVSERALQEQLRDGEVGAAQFLAQENALIDQRLAAQREFYAKKLELAVGDEVQQAEIQKEITKAEQKALLERQTAENQAHQAALSQWRSLGKNMEQSFMSNIKGMMQGTETFGQAVRNIFRSMVDSLLDMFVKMAVQWAESMLLQKMEGKSAATSQIAANASTYATAAMASVAAIPFAGWAMAPEVGMAAYAGGMAYEAGLSAAGGFDIPTGMNPVTQLHQKEMVLPAAYADVIRGLAANGGAPGDAGGGQQGGGGSVTVQINALDSRSVEQWLRSGGDKQIAQALQRQRQMFNPNMRS